MKFVEITRSRQSEQGIVGILAIDNIPFCITMEQPWNNNIPFKSCVPAGFYYCKRFNSPTYGWTFEIQNVPNGRKYCLFHWGNRVMNTVGCVLTARWIGLLEGDLAILDSHSTFDRFMARMEDVEIFGLCITQPALP